MEEISGWERIKNRSRYIWNYYTSLSLKEKAFISLFNYIWFKEKQLQDFIVRGKYITQFEEAKAKNQAQCSHLKGGHVDLTVGVFQRGDKVGDFSVCKHQLPFGDYIVKCLRCGKKWTVPKREDFKTELDFHTAYLQYKGAVDFPTHNVTSTGIQFQKLEKKSFRETISIVWSILKRDISVLSSLRDTPYEKTLRLT